MRRALNKDISERVNKLPIYILEISKFIQGEQRLKVNTWTACMTFSPAVPALFTEVETNS